MTTQHLFRVAIVGASLCACAEVEPVETGAEEQPGMTLQGMTLQGMTLQGMTLQGMSMQGFRFDGATLGGSDLSNLRVERGELVAEQGGTTLRGADLTGAQLQAQVRSTGGDPPTTALAAYRITAIEPEVPGYDPTQTGATFLYTLEQWDDSTGAWGPACPADSDGRRVAIPVAATWDERGNRVESSTMFTLGCTTGVIAKCYRWGYRPWVSGYGDLAMMHQTCTRVARADYCGDGVSHTRNGTLINIWDRLPAPGPIQRHGGLETVVLPPMLIFEAAWDKDGAVCLSHERWTKVQNVIGQTCPGNRLLSLLGQVTCGDPVLARLLHPSAVIFNESLNLDL